LQRERQYKAEFARAYKELEAEGLFDDFVRALNRRDKKACTAKAATTGKKHPLKKAACRKRPKVAASSASACRVPLAASK
jgi:phage regulator Rha-like protein